MIYRSHRRTAARKGIILLVVLALLTLFAIAGLAFVFYAQSRADSARVYREAQLKSLSSGPDTPPELLFNDWLRQFIFDVPDNGQTSFLNSALRGHSLARSMYGGPPSGAYAVTATGWANPPYAGTGRLHTASAGTGAGGIDDFSLVNYTLYAGDSRDPESFGGARANFSTSYTYPDMNNMFLAAVRADGTVITPSFYRKWSFDPGNLGLNNVANPNWTNAQGKYLLLRPRPNDNGAGFPYPSDATGDVNNLGGGGNDSIWMDIGAPVKVLADGTLYKPLYAALVVDLDGRVNVNIAGNIRGAGGAQVSNMGMGAWEMNLKDVLTVDATEWPKLFTGNGTTTGRYGANNQPDVSYANNQTVNLRSPNSAIGAYSYNFDDYAISAASATLALPTGTGVAFPSKPAGWSSATAAELASHPQLYNIFAPGGDDTVFSVAAMKSLLYVGPTGGTASTSTLGKLCPNTLGANSLLAARARRLITTISFDVDAPGVMPWNADGTNNYTMAATGALFPPGGAQAFPTTVATVTGGAANTEFGAGGQATEVTASLKLGRIDLNRKLTDYPAPDTEGRIDPTNAAYTQAVTDRQVLAADIFVRLVAVTGAFNPFTTSTGAGIPSQSQVDALRYLAQLAVNMVDYIDNDDYMTPFNWTKATLSTGQSTLTFDAYVSTNSMDPIGKGWVFGTELPKVVLNEAYAEIDNDTSDTGAIGSTTFVNLNFYVELYNPFVQDPSLWNNSAGLLQMGTGTGTNKNPWAVHQVVITKPNTKLRDANNTLGNPDGTVLLTVADYTADPNANPAAAGSVFGGATPAGTNASWIGAAPVGGPYNGASGQNSIMYVLGPGSNTKNATKNTGPSIPYTLPVKLQTSATTQFTDSSYTGASYDSGMSYKISIGDYKDAAKYNTGGNPGAYSILLRRLACPNLPPQTNPANPNYNPYVTVDFVDSMKAFDGVTQIDGVVHPMAVALASRTSFAKSQPYASDAAQWTAESATPAGQPMNSFFAQNSPGNQSFDWLTHLDRPLVSPMELLQVSSFKPHELTQQFINATKQVDTSTGSKFQHRVPWTNVSTRLYRAFEFLETKSRLPGTQLGGRIPGKININTIWDPEVFRALCDAQTSNSAGGFGVAANDVDAVYSAMVAQRTPNAPIGAPTPALSANDQPFQGMAAGYDTNVAVGPAGAQYQPGDGRSGAGGIGLQNTLLAPGASSKLLFEGPGTAATQHPYLRAMLLNKIYNNTTTRSNVFGVWLTVGFFQVSNTSTTPPPTLMGEWGLASGQNIRHHMFCIVDRSALGIQGAQIATGQGAVSSLGVQTVNLPAPIAKIQPGTVLMIDDAPNQESVVVRTVGATSFTANFGKTHSAGFKIYVVNPGNPGPQPGFNAKDSTAIVPFYSVID